MLASSLFTLVLCADAGPAEDPLLSWLKPVALEAGLTFAQDGGAPDRSIDLDGDGRADAVVLLTRELDGATRLEHHAYLVGTRGWRGWLVWGRRDTELLRREAAWHFCQPGSGSGHACGVVEFTSGRARVVKETQGNAAWSTDCDYSTGVCTRCEPCSAQDGEQPSFTQRRVPPWSAALPDDLEWTAVSTRRALSRWLQRRSSR